MGSYRMFSMALLALPIVVLAAPPEKPGTQDVNVTNEPTVHVGNSVDVNVVNIADVDAAIVNEPTVQVGNTVDVNAYQAGDWNLTVGETPRDFVELTGHFRDTDGWVEIYQVPAGRRLVITDIYFIQRTYGGWINTISLNRNHESSACGIGSTTFMFTQLLGLTAGERNQVHFPLRTGYEFTSGERICVAQSGGGLIFHNLSGFETDA
ncbi:MAG: hypothetical protein HKN58_10055 [Xanthomonadales bacterium]|nr:hypothetical protein [Xanthomonadales bacterium]